MAEFDYFREEESEQFSFFRIPKILFSDDAFSGLSTDAKLLYGILLDRISLSRKNGWIDNEGRVYIIYTIKEMKEIMNMSHAKINRLLKELDTDGSGKGLGIIERQHQGLCLPNVIYVKNFLQHGREAKHKMNIPEVTKCASRRYQNEHSGNNKMCIPEVTKRESIYTDYNKTDFSDTERSKRASVSEEEHFISYGKFNNVVLSALEVKELMRMFPYDWKNRIESLSNYMKAHGKYYQNHFATICMWAERDRGESGVINYDCPEGECL